MFRKIFAQVCPPAKTTLCRFEQNCRSVNPYDVSSASAGERCQNTVSHLQTARPPPEEAIFLNTFPFVPSKKSCSVEVLT